MKLPVIVVAGFVLLGIISPVVPAIYEKNCIHFEESYTFSEDRYVGKWYEIRRLDDPDTDHDVENCVQEKYTRSPNMLDYNIVRSVQPNASAEPVYSTGVATPRVMYTTVVPQFYLRYNTTSPANPDIPIDVIKTDYTNYAIVYACTQINESTASESAWIYSRRPTVSKQTAEVINKFVASKFNHPEHKWRITEQTDTFCKPTTITSGVSPSGLHVSFVQLLLILLLTKAIF